MIRGRRKTSALSTPQLDEGSTVVRLYPLMIVIPGHRQPLRAVQQTEKGGRRFYSRYGFPLPRSTSSADGKWMRPCASSAFSWATACLSDCLSRDIMLLKEVMFMFPLSSNGIKVTGMPNVAKAYLHSVWEPIGTNFGVCINRGRKKSMLRIRRQESDRGKYASKQPTTTETGL